ncbi:MAG: SIMPL domain-containing protein [Chloroflexota bacterium]
MKTANNRVLAAVSLTLSALLILGAFTLTWLLPRNAATASAQSNNQQAAQPSQITVVGTGSISVKPDILKVTIGVAQQENTVKAAQDKVDSTIAALYEKLKAAGIDEKDYKTAQYTVEPVMDFNNPKGQNGQGTLAGFRVTNMIEITFRDTAAAPAVIDALVDAGANTVYGTNFSLSNVDALGQQVYEAAVKDAQGRAEKIAALSNMNLGKIISVSEVSNGQPVPMYQKGMGAGGAGDFAPGSQNVQTSLIVTYEASAK